MHRLRYYMNWKLSTKTFLLTFLLTEVIILLLGYSYYNYSSNILVSAQTKYAIDMNAKTNNYLETQLRSIRNFAASIVGDSRLLEDSPTEINRWFHDNLLYLLPTVNNIHYIQDGRVTASTSSIGWMLMNNETFKWNRVRVLEANKLYWTEPYWSEASQYTVTFFMLVPGKENSRMMLALDIGFEKLYEALLPDAPDLLHGELILLDAANRPIYGKGSHTRYNVYTNQVEWTDFPEAILEAPWNEYSLSLPESATRTDYFLTRSSNNVMNWQVMWMMDKTELLRPLEATVRFTAALAVASLILALVIAWIMSKMIGQPIRQFALSLDEISSGNLNAKIPVNRRDEIGNLARHFNRMTKQIGLLIEDLKTTEAKKKAFEIRMLQAQIKPHFLFNTLNAISMKSREGDLSKVDLLISSLTRQLDYSLTQTMEDVSLKDELNAVEHYIQLMQVRYEGRFDYETDIDPATLSYRLPKFTLQPIVENCIFHGLSPMQGSGTLFIGSTRDGDDWELLIEDNGIGIPEDMLGKLRAVLLRDSVEEADEEEGIGFANVHYRLRTLYGPAYSMSLDSSADFGTRILIRMPVVIQP
ncbi:histidine kinase [Paenibacillus sp. GD4]|uniref:sensor histidine kinase n=1 Tax=Paenibacillus sp. GD4 TaxID=3068890 RepID=UPI002796850E|nr:histidine kinase [Paenibacillus sp. GD4]MDQ1910514.1 histidine kinase [Paenibacillus sp. GD4]